MAGLPPRILADLVEPLGRPDWSVDLVLVDDKAMAGLNEGFRKVSGVTDVLSFSYLLDTGAGEPDLARGRGHAFNDLWLDTLSVTREDVPAQAVGEIVLAPGFVAGRCREEGWAPEHEFPLLVVHGVLHVLGWDHISDPEAVAMQAVEVVILAAGGLPHPIRERG